jgi:hypothetical protein
VAEHGKLKKNLRKKFISWKSYVISRVCFWSGLASARIRVGAPRVALLVHLNNSSGRADRAFASAPLRFQVDDQIRSRDVLHRVSVEIRARLQFFVMSSAQPTLDENEDNNENENSSDCSDGADYSSRNSRAHSDFVFDCYWCVLSIINLKSIILKQNFSNFPKNSKNMSIKYRDCYFRVEITWVIRLENQVVSI